jgi:hypothetical protein
VPEAPTPVPAWFPGFAEAIGGIRLSQRGNVELVSRYELKEITEKLTRGGTDAFYTGLASWFLADPTQRIASPF